MKESAKQEEPFCPECGSNEIVTDAWVSWNMKTQCWEIEEIFDNSFCYNCENTVNKTQWRDVKENEGGH